MKKKLTNVLLTQYRCSIRSQKRKSATPEVNMESMAKVLWMNKAQVTEVDARDALELWRGPVARMW